MTFMKNPTTRPICIRRLTTSVSALVRTQRKWLGKCVRKDGAFCRLDSVSALEECGGLGSSEEKERKEGEEKANDDTVEYRPCARGALRGPAPSTQTPTANPGINPTI